LVSWNAKRDRDGAGAKVNFEAENTQSAECYIIERSVNGGYFDRVARFAADKGARTQKIDWKDENIPAKARVAYRVMRIDREDDGLNSNKYTIAMQDLKKNEATADYKLLITPNPVSSSATIQFEIPEEEKDEKVTLKATNLLGQTVAILWNNKQRDPGMNEMPFDASRLKSGLYFFILQVGGRIETVTMIKK
jgi:hypothetical protein